MERFLKCAEIVLTVLVFIVSLMCFAGFSVCFAFDFITGLPLNMDYITAMLGSGVMTTLCAIHLAEDS